MHPLPGIDLAAFVNFLGYPGLFTVIFLESGVFFGFFLPGASLLFITGVLSAAGVFNIWFLVPLLWFAAVLGDNVGYLFGAKVGTRLFSRPDSRFFRQKHVDQTRLFFERYGTRTIVFARFVPIVRTFAPILAGVGGMNYRLFFIYNILGAFLWVCGVTLLGFFVGARIPNAENYLTPIILVIIFLTCIPLILQWWRREKMARVTFLPKVAVFDLDDTLTESFKPPKPETLETLDRLLNYMPVAIMSAAGFPRIEREFLPVLSKNPHVSRLYLFPNSTAECYRWSGSQWERVYGDELTEEERKRIKQAVLESVVETKVLEGITPRGEQLIDRRTQIAFAALGLDASDEEKKSWDVDKSKRVKLRKAIRRRISGFEILIGGRTTLDITRKGITKAHGIRWLSKYLDIKPKGMLYVGDALYRGGNDAPVIQTGIRTLSTSGPEETLGILKELLEVASTGSAKK